MTAAAGKSATTSGKGGGGGKGLVLPAPLAAPALDFEALLSRDYRPHRVTQLIPREAYKHDGNHGKKKKKRHGSAHQMTTAKALWNLLGSGGAPAPSIANKPTTTPSVLDESTSKLILGLVTHTPAYTRHMTPEQKYLQEQQDREGDGFDAVAALVEKPSPLFLLQQKNPPRIDPALHEVELGDWESKIAWHFEDINNPGTVGSDNRGSEGSDDGTDMTSSKPENASSAADDGGSGVTGFPSYDPMALLRKPRNPFLDSLRLDETTVCWDASNTEQLLERARNAPLLLEWGVAGQSVANAMHQQSSMGLEMGQGALPQRPPSAVHSEPYQQRMEKEWGKSATAQNITSTADVAQKGSLHADKDKMEALIAARQEKRAQMAKDKTNRVTEAMGTLAMGGGRGRTITSSLMGPGGTERTGRPSRLATSSATHDAEYIEQLDLVTSHAMVRDLSRVLYRQYNRPKLPLGVIRPDLLWQFQIRYNPKPTKAAGDGSGGAGGPGSATTFFGGATTPGALSKAKLRTENDLTPTEGQLVVLEYCEQTPPIQLTKGMGSKIVNYYRGDKSKCPVSAGGGDRPARRKKPTASGSGGADGDAANAMSGNVNKLERLYCHTDLEKGDNKNNRNNNSSSSKGGKMASSGSNSNVLAWVGPLPKKTQKERSKDEAIHVLPEGATEILHPKVHGPFVGEVEEGMTVTAIVNNLFVAPLFRHEPESTDFLMTLTPPGGHARPGQRESMGVVLRAMPASLFTVGQTEPRTRVYAPNTQGEKNFVGPFVSYQIARTLSRSQAREGHGMRFDELQDRVLPNLELPANALRQRLKQVAVYDKNTQIWTTKPVGFEDYPGVEFLGKQIAPEGVAAFETACAASRRLSDLGISALLEKGTHAVVSVGVTMVYLAGQLAAARDLSKKLKKLCEISRSNRKMEGLQVRFYERAAAELESSFKSIKEKYTVAQFIYEELQLSPWHLTGEFIEVHKRAEGTGMMKLTGLADPSGTGEGYSFLREVDTKPSKSVGPLNAQKEKITGTEDDLRKLTMKQMATLLRSYGMSQKHIDTLKRWDRVHVIRDLSTKAASDGIGDGLERFARGEKMKLSEQKQMYRDRIQVIWKRQIAALSADSGDRGSGEGGGGTSGSGRVGEGVDAAGGPGSGAAQAQAKKNNADKDQSDSDSDDDDDDLVNQFEEEMMDRSEANQLVVNHAGRGGSEGGLGQLRAATQDQDITRDAHELAALKRQREEERAAQEGLKGMKKDRKLAGVGPSADRKVIRKCIIKTHPDGRQSTTFKYILRPDEVGKAMARLQQKDNSKPRNREINFEPDPDERPPGHAMFEDEDDFDYSGKGRSHSGKRRAGGGHRRRAATTTAVSRTQPRAGAASGASTARNLHLGKLKTKVSKEERMRKRKREEEELEVYASSAKRKGTSNRRERGSIRDRRPHVIFAEKLESIRAPIEARPYVGPFLKAVNRRLLPMYYEVISHPMDLQSIRDKIGRYEYRTADAMLKDFELMKSNAIKYNGQTHALSQEAIAIYDVVKEQMESNRETLNELEEAVKEQMSGKPKKKKKQQQGSGSKKQSASGTSGNVANVGGVDVNLGDLSSMNFDGESDSDDSVGDMGLDL